MHRVAVTGMGSISALGHTTAVMAEGLRRGRTAIGPLSTMPTDALQIKIGGEVVGFDPLQHFTDKQLGLLDRNAQLALVAAREAARQSGLDFRGKLSTRTAAIIGSGVGGMGTLDDSFRRLYLEQAKRFFPFVIPKLMVSAAVSHVTMELGITGPSFTVASACSSANHAIGTAFQLVRAGAVDAA